MARAAPRIFPVIMAGGSGTRFWPLSRKAKPKQFLPLASKQPLLVDTAARMKGLHALGDLLVVCGKGHAKAVAKLLPKLPKKNLLIEPSARNTAPAIALATAHVAARDPNGVLVVLPSDHHVGQVNAFREAIAAAAELAMEGPIVTLGIRPHRPDTGFGYVRTGEAIGTRGAQRVAAFVEKPDATTAERYLASGDYLWNAGIFVFRADVMLEAFAKHMPGLADELTKVRASLGSKKYERTLASAFPKMPATSIDYGVAERAENIAVLPGDFGWSDVGSFSALPEVWPLDARGNVVKGKGAVLVDCDDCVVLAQDRPLAVVGLQGMVVVDAGDATLVLPKDKAGEVRQVVEALRSKKWESAL